MIKYVNFHGHELTRGAILPKITLEAFYIAVLRYSFFHFRG